MQWLTRIPCSCLALAIVTGSLAAEEQAPPDLPKSSTKQQTQVDKSADKKSDLKSPLLRGLRQSILESEAFDKSDVADSLVEQLDAADATLSTIRAQNQLALKHVSRQVRVGAAKRTSNLLLITVDRLGWGDLGCYGQTSTQTPHLDGLASEGLKLTQYYAASAKAEAARWCLLTGRAAAREPRDRRDRFRVRQEQVTLAETLWDAGYVTAYFGPWANGDRPLDHGYENWSGYFNAAEFADGFPEKIQVDGSEVKIVENLDGAKVHSYERLLIGEISAWLKQVSRQRRQFMAHIALSVFPETSATTARTAAEYRQRIENADKLIGRILQCLDDAELSASTCIFVTAESGPSFDWNRAAEELRSTGPFRLAGHGLAEGNLRVPAIVRWPDRVKAGEESNQVSGTWDIAPTCADIVSALRRPLQLDGLSLVPTIAGTKPKSHELLYWEFGEEDIGQAVRIEGWKGIRAAGDKQLRLYRLEDDPAEQHDRAAEFPEIVKRMYVKR